MQHSRNTQIVDFAVNSATAKRPIHALSVVPGPYPAALEPGGMAAVPPTIERRLTVLDRMGLLFFMVLGVLAYAVDFATGTLYLPKRATHNGHFDIAAATAVDTGRVNRDDAGLRQVIRVHTGQETSMSDPAVRVRRAESTRWQRLHDALDPIQLAAFTRRPLALKA